MRVRTGLIPAPVTLSLVELLSKEGNRKQHQEPCNQGITNSILEHKHSNFSSGGSNDNRDSLKLCRAKQNLSAAPARSCRTQAREPKQAASVYVCRHRRGIEAEALSTHACIPHQPPKNGAMRDMAIFDSAKATLTKSIKHLKKRHINSLPIVGINCSQSIEVPPITKTQTAHRLPVIAWAG